MLRACHFSLISNSTFELFRSGRTSSFFADVNMLPSLKCQIGQARERGGGYVGSKRIKAVTPSRTFKALLVCLSDVREPLCLVEQLGQVDADVAVLVRVATLFRLIVLVLALVVE